jgi:hypothetical protein
VTPDAHGGGPAKHWTAKIRLAIEASGSDGARAITEETLQQMGLLAEDQPELTDFFMDGPRPCWYVITRLDLSGLGSVAPDDAPTRFKLMTRKLAGIPFMGHGNDDCGLWEWMPDNWGPAADRVFPHSAIRAAGIYISAGPASGMWLSSR